MREGPFLPWRRELWINGPWHSTFSIYFGWRATCRESKPFHLELRQHDTVVDEIMRDLRQYETR